MFGAMYISDLYSVYPSACAIAIITPEVKARFRSPKPGE